MRERLAMAIPVHREVYIWHHDGFMDWVAEKVKRDFDKHASEWGPVVDMEIIEQNELFGIDVDELLIRITTTGVRRV